MYALALLELNYRGYIIGSYAFRKHSDGHESKPAMCILAII